MSHSIPAAATTAELPVRAVTLSNAGLIQIERAGELPPDAAVAFRAPAEDVDDLLKSLVVRDPEGEVEGVRLPAQDLEVEAFRGLPLVPADFTSRWTLLGALRGQEVEAGGATGRLAGVEESEAGLRLALVTAEGLRFLLLREGEEVRLADAALARRVGRAAEALAAARRADERLVTVHLRGARGAREVGLAYVAGAPLWKPSWRLLVPSSGTGKEGEARLQGWAVVENRSGADWEGVRLSLVSGNPAAYRQALYTPVFVRRPELPVRMAERVMVEADTGARPAPPELPSSLREVVRSAVVPRSPGDVVATMAGPARVGALPTPDMMALPPKRFSDMVAAVAAGTAAPSAGRVSFVLPAPVTVRSGETANLPFLDARLPAEQVWWVQDLAARHPLGAVRIRNTTGHALPDGLATVYGAEGVEAGAHLGDAELRAAAPGETRIIAFARDRDVLLSAAHASDERPVRAALGAGMVQVDTLRRDETALALDPRGTAGKLVVDLPRRPGAAPRFAVAMEGDFGLRHEATLDGATTTLRFVWEREGRQEIPLWDAGLGNPVLLRWREVDVEGSLRRLPGGPGSLEALQTVLERLPSDAQGLSTLLGVVEALADLRRLLDIARAAVRRYAAVDAVLDRARIAVEDRTGSEREAAQRRLNGASLEAEEAGGAADAAWEAWRRGVEELLARTD